MAENSEKRRGQDSPSSVSEIPWIADNGLRVVDRTNQSIRLTWTINSESPILDSSQDVSINAEGQGYFDGAMTDEWYEVQMNTIGTDEWIPVYKGFKTECEVVNLNPDANVRFRMKKNNEYMWGSCVSAATDASPPNADDLHRAVSLHAEDMVLRIIGGTKRSSYKGPSIKKLMASHDRNGLTPLMNACQDGQLSLVKTLLRVGGNIDAVAVSNKKTALMAACASGHPYIVQLLSNSGADWSITDCNGCTALHHAVTSGNIRVVEIALENSPDKLLTAYDSSGWTPMLRCVIVGESVEVLKVLLHRNANANDVDRRNTKTCLMAAVTMGKAGMVRELLANGADPSYRNKNNQTALEIAKGFEFTEIEAMLEEALKNKKLYGPIHSHARHIHALKQIK